MLFAFALGQHEKAGKLKNELNIAV